MSAQPHLSLSLSLSLSLFIYTLPHENRLFSPVIEGFAWAPVARILLEENQQRNINRWRVIEILARN